MIKAYIQEQLGNQLFIYAVGRKAAILKNQTLYLDLTFFGRKRIHYKLDQFNISAKELNPYLHLILAKLKIRKKVSVYYSGLPIRGAGHVYDPKVFDFSEDCFLYGMFQSHLYINDIKPVLKNEITLKYYKPSYEELEIDEQIRSTPSVAVHVRRGDYTRIGYLDVCTPEYYMKAINYIKEKVPGAKFFVFSNDLEYCKQNISVQNGMYVRYNGSSDPTLGDFRLMQICKHFIISNSTFSWWPAFLSDNNSIVVCPYKWANNNEFPIEEKALPHWTLMHF